MNDDNRQHKCPLCDGKGKLTGTEYNEVMGSFFVWIMRQLDAITGQLPDKAIESMRHYAKKRRENEA